MYSVECIGINTFLKSACKLLLDEGCVRKTRGYRCIELPGPAIFKIFEPTARLITIPQRKWNWALPYAESLWIASGRNDMNFMNYYLPRLMDYSDDGVSMRGGYGPRFRHFSGIRKDYYYYSIRDCTNTETDQLRYSIECLKQDINSRRAIIVFGDPNKDCFSLNGAIKETKDIPCTQTIQFVKNSITNKLDMYVFMRSNDLLWGASAVNIFNYTFILEYVSAIIGLEIGSYYHITTNLHYYEDKKDMVEAIAKENEIIDFPYVYNKTFTTLQEFDCLIKKLSIAENEMRNNKEISNNILWEDDFFRDWYNVLRAKITGQIEYFSMPLLNNLIH